ncbi:IS481 family transposase [Empedobacter sp.]|nr:IS481 family transposase [Empedobacter sp.]
MIKKTKEIAAYLTYSKKLQVLKYAKEYGNNSIAYKFFGVKKSTFYKWKKAYDEHGEEGLLRKKPTPRTFPNQIKQEIVNKVLELRKEHKLGTWRIKWYLERYHDILISESSVYRILKRNNVGRLDRKVTRRAMHSIRYEKETLGHHVQDDAKFLIFQDANGHKIKRFQYTAIDDATRIRALKIYEKHNQLSSIDFINYVVDKFPFRINTIQTDNGHEFQSKFHWHVQDLGMRHRFIKVGTPQLNGKVERSHLTDKKEFYQLLSYTDDVDLNQKLEQWEKFYNFNRPHFSFKG